MINALPITRQDMLAWAERELVMRQRAYPPLVDQGKMTKEHADQELALMAAIVRELREGPSS